MFSHDNTEPTQNDTDVFQTNATYSQDMPLAMLPVEAGFPSPAEESSLDKIDLNKHLIRHPASTFFVRVQGDSMKEQGIYSGDLVVVDKSIEARDGHTIIALLNGEFTIKKLQRNKTEIVLCPANSQYTPIAVKPSDDFEVWGVVTGVVRNLISPTGK